MSARYRVDRADLNLEGYGKPGSWRGLGPERNGALLRKVDGHRLENRNRIGHAPPFREGSRIRRLDDAGITGAHSEMKTLVGVVAARRQRPPQIM
jgi:hypothetical protein